MIFNQLDYQSNTSATPPPQPDPPAANPHYPAHHKKATEQLHVPIRSSCPVLLCRGNTAWKDGRWDSRIPQW